MSTLKNATIGHWMVIVILTTIGLWSCNPQSPTNEEPDYNMFQQDKEDMKADATTCPHCGHVELNKWMWLMILFFMTPFICCILYIIAGMLSSLLK